MEITQSLLDLLNFDPILIGVFAALSMLFVQAFKPVWSVARDYPQLVSMAFAFVFGTLITLQVTWLLQIFILMYLMMIGASGIYSSAKGGEKKENQAGL